MNKPPTDNKPEQADTKSKPVNVVCGACGWITADQNEEETCTSCVAGVMSVHDLNDILY